MAEEESKSLLEMSQRSHITDSSSSTSTLQPSSSTLQPPVAVPQQISIPTTDDDFSWKSLFISILRAHDILQPPPGAAPQQVSISMPVQLTMDNYISWKSFFIPILRAYDAFDLAEGREQCPPQFLSSAEDNKKVENPAYMDWIKRDQRLLAWINASLSKSLLIRYSTGCTSGRALWLNLENQFAEKARARVKQLKDRLANLNKEKPHLLLMEDYLKLAKQIADDLQEAGSPVDDSEFVSCVLQGLPLKYDAFSASIRNRSEPVTREELHDLLLSHTFPPSTGGKICIIIFLFGIILMILGAFKLLSSVVSH